MNKRAKTVFIIIVLIILVLMLLKKLDIKNMILERMYPTTYKEYVYECSSEHDIDPLLTFAIIKTESNFEPDSISASDAKGLMQLMDSTAEELAEKLELGEYDIFDEKTNIYLGTRYISTLLNYYNDNIYLALAAYNAGIGNVNKWIDNGVIKPDGSDIENIPYKETENYVRKVVRDYRIYSELY